VNSVVVIISIDVGKQELFPNNIGGEGVPISNLLQDRHVLCSWHTCHCGIELAMGEDRPPQVDAQPENCQPVKSVKRDGKDKLKRG
jgi:hypothetical protein